MLPFYHTETLLPWPQPDGYVHCAAKFGRYRSIADKGPRWCEIAMTRMTDAVDKVGD